MKHLLNGVAIAAALAIAAPVWAQAPMTPSTNAPKPTAAAPAAAPAAAAPAASKPVAAKQKHRPMRRMAHRRAVRARGGENAMTDQLNREELARIQGGAPMGAMGTPNAGAGQGGPRPSGH